MKKIIVLILCFILTGCVQVNEADLTKDLDNFLIDIKPAYKQRVNNSTAFYSYYLPSDMQEIDGNSNAAIISYKEAKVAMNINVAGIINETYYKDKIISDEGFFNPNQFFYQKAGSFVRNDNTNSSYYLLIAKNEQVYYIYLITDEVDFYGYSNKYDLVSTIKHLFIMAESVEMDKKAIIANYSYKDIIDYRKKQIDLFDYVIPSSGYLSDLVKAVDGKIVHETEEIIEPEND